MGTYCMPVFGALKERKTKYKYKIFLDIVNMFMLVSGCGQALGVAAMTVSVMPAARVDAGRVRALHSFAAS